jgi:hypothetical protein
LFEQREAYSELSEAGEACERERHHILRSCERIGICQKFVFRLEEWQIYAKDRQAFTYRKVFR